MPDGSTPDNSVRDVRDVRVFGTVVFLQHTLIAYAVVYIQQQQKQQYRNP